MHRVHTSPLKKIAVPPRVCSNRPARSGLFRPHICLSKLLALPPQARLFGLGVSIQSYWHLVLGFPG